MNNPMRLLLPIAAATTLLVSACASIGRPDGGPRDETPPRFIAASPSPGAVGFDGRRIVLTFDENVQLNSPADKVVVSPPQIQQPGITANGRHVTVTLKDTLIPNTTYTIDFSDAVTDLNEGNPLEGLAIDFATGQELDTLRISGIVLEGRTLEPAQGMLVGVYSTDADSAISTLRMERIAKTDQYGQFTVRNLKPGSYQIFALNDLNRDYHWDRTEDVAFCDSLISPSAHFEMVADTLLSSLEEDSVVVHQVVRYLPDDVLLTWFNEQYRAQYLKEYSRVGRNIISLEMAAPADSLPRLTVIASGSDSMRLPVDSVSVLERSLSADTLRYWLTDTSLIRSDSLLIETTYRRVDSLDRIVWATDTLKFFTKRPRGKKQKEESARQFHVRTLQEKIDSVRERNDTIAIDTFALSQPDAWLGIKLVSTTQDLHKPLYIESDQPLASVDTAGIRLEIMVDTVWTPVAGFNAKLEPVDSVSLRRFKIEHKWKPEAKYRLLVDSMAIRGIYPVYNKPIQQEIMAKSLEDYSTILFNVTGLDTVPAIVELLGSSDTPVASAPMVNGRCTLRYIAPGTYYARLYIDADGSGSYTDGSMSERRQPEETYYFPKKLTLKKNWDLEQGWNIFELPIDQQKPLEIKKNKPKEKATDGASGSGLEDDEDDDDGGFGGFGDTGFGSNSRRGSSGAFRTSR